MNRWELETAVRLQAGYGHSPERAMALASFMRWDIEIGLRKPGPLIIITSC